MTKNMMKPFTHKNIFNLFFAISCVMLPQIVRSQITNDIFEKKWRIVFDIKQRIAKMPDDERRAYQKLTPEQQQQVESDLVLEIEKSVFTFSTDNSFRVEFEGKPTYQGTWRIAEDGKSVVLRTKEGIEERIVIRKIEPEKVIVANALHQQAPEIVLVPTTK